MSLHPEDKVAEFDQLPQVGLSFDDLKEYGETDPKLVNSVVETAERLLSQRYGGTQKLSDIKDLGGSGIAVVLRARVAPSPFLQQRSVVLKYMPATDLLYDKTTLLREIVAYQFTTSLSEEVRPGPVLLAYDVDERLIVLSDSGDGDTFAELLDTNDEQLRVSILRNLGEAIGKMHADTANKEQDFLILQKRMFAKYPDVQAMFGYRERLLWASLAVGQELLVRAGIEISDVVKDFANDAGRRLMSGQHRAFTPFDLSPDNIIVSERTHFLDYEWAGFRDATFDVACVIAGFPQFLFARPVTDDEADVFIESWVHEVGKIWPNVNNSTRLSARIVTAMVGWALTSLMMMLLSAEAEMSAEFFHGDFDLNDLDLAMVVDRMAPIADQVLAKNPANLTDEAQMIRQDLRETFEAMYRYAERGRDPRFPEVAAFARSVVELLEAPNTTASFSPSRASGQV